MVLRKVYYPDSQDVKAEWEELPDGRQHGKYYEYHRNGKVKREGENHYNKEDGLWREFDENGNEISQTKYSDGVRQSLTRWDENHNLKDERKFDKNGELIQLITYNKDGLIKNKTYVDTEGITHKEFYRNGQLDGGTLTYPDGTEIRQRVEGQIIKIFKEGQKKAQVRNTVTQVKARRAAKRG